MLDIPENILSKTTFTASKISITPDLPPVIRELKTSIMNQRKSLPAEIKAKAKVKYHQNWPYISLKLADGNSRYLEQSVQATVKKFYTLGLATVEDADPYK